MWTFVILWIRPSVATEATTRNQQTDWMLVNKLSGAQNQVFQNTEKTSSCSLIYPYLSPCLRGSKPTVMTDYEAITWLRTMKKTMKKLEQWRIFIIVFNFNTGRQWTPSRARTVTTKNRRKWHETIEEQNHYGGNMRQRWRLGEKFGEQLWCRSLSK